MKWGISRMIFLYCHKQCKNRGFLLIELLITISIAGILLAVGVPAFSGFINRIKVLSETTELLESFSLARQYAINSNQHVSICGSTSGNNCDGNWQAGFIIYTHSSGKADYLGKAQTPLLYHYETGDTFTTKGNIRRFTFRPSGVLKGKSGSLLYCPKEKTAENYKRIVISRGGRIRAYDQSELKKINHLSPMSCE